MHFYSFSYADFQSCLFFLSLYYSIPSTPAASWMASFQPGICNAWHQCIVFECRISVCVTLSKKALLHLKDCCVLFCGMYTSVIIFVCAESQELVYGLFALFWVPLSKLSLGIPLYYALTSSLHYKHRRILIVYVTSKTMKLSLKFITDAGCDVEGV